MGAELLIGAALAAASAGTQYYNTQKTAKRADSALAEQIRNQGRKQREADAKVNERVTDLEGSTSADERAQRLGDYMQNLRANRGKVEAGLTPNIGSSAFRDDAAQDAADVMAHAGQSADLLSRIDAAGLQRQGEAFGYGNLATGLSLIGREARGQNWLDELRLRRASQRNAGLDLFSGLLGAGAGAVGSGSGAGGWADSGAAGVSPISGVTVTGGGTGFQGNSAFGAWGKKWGGDR